MKPRYRLHPGPIRSKSDGEIHHVSAAQLAELYRVDFNECVVAAQPRAFDRAASYRSDPHDHLIQLYPRAANDYNLFTLYWRDGKRNVIVGPDPATAMNKAGYGAGAVATLDFYATGDDRDYVWDAVARDWKRVSPIEEPADAG